MLLTVLKCIVHWQLLVQIAYNVQGETGVIQDGMVMIPCGNDTMALGSCENTTTEIDTVTGIGQQCRASGSAWRKEEARPLVSVSALCSLQCSDTNGWVTPTTVSGLKQLFKSQEGHPAVKSITILPENIQWHVSLLWWLCEQKNGTAATGCGWKV